MKKLKYILLIPVIISILIIIVSSILHTKIEINERLITIQKGANASQIVDLLFENKIIKNKIVFYYYIIFKNSTEDLDYGNYFFDGKLSMLNVLAKIKDGKVRLKKVTIPEGLNTTKVCKILSENGLGNCDSLKTLMNNPTFAQELTGLTVPNLEGFLYPETYYFPDKVSEIFVIKHLIKSFYKQTADLNFHENNLDFYQIIILASIIEKEARLIDEMPKIASVYHNRLVLNYRLQADPTIAFAIEQQGKSRKKIYLKDLKIDSPYNTYQNYGLPPTPICSPSINAISAALNPDDTDLLYFFADGSGGHEFSKNFNDHQNKLNQMRNHGR